MRGATFLNQALEIEAKTDEERTMRGQVLVSSGSPGRGGGGVGAGGGKRL